ncbi:sialate:O-sulfotransferase 1-like [Mytilus edulis]|uniref:sialate:O-sulfotransferase 1-like n=1 Tax=Mytilus edulis TaxID=6550 RepID=UPI0039EFD580
MTNDMCASHCCSSLNDATFMGTELRKECYCSNAPNNDSFVKTELSECNEPCGGNSDEFCGALYRLSLYSLDCSPETIVPSVSKVTTESTLHCLQINNTVWTEEELAEKLYLLRNAISIDKKGTKLYRATKMSAYDPRKSSRNIGIVGIIVLVVPVIFVVVIDVHRICQ